MSWSRVKKGKKPVGWWYHKVLCEAAWAFKNTTGYYHHLDKLCGYGFNLYGQEIPEQRNVKKSPK
jgi:hypothetical protein